MLGIEAVSNKRLIISSFNPRRLPTGKDDIVGLSSRPTTGRGHWHADLPLPEEVDIIPRQWSRFVIMIDDFQVPDDAGYIYDRYGKGKDLTLETISDPIRMHHLGVYFPSRPSSEEPSIRRGYVVLSNEALSDQLAGIESLRRWKSDR